MNFLKLALISLFTLSLNGCTTIKIPQASGGSRSDGIIEMSFNYGLFEKPEIQWDKALTEAVARCKSWGYRSAERFNRGTADCQNYDPRYGCINTLVTVKYQCI